jgi:hypothetical protein
MLGILLTLALAISVSSAALAQQTAVPETQARQIIKQARAAIWDETKTGTLQSLSLDASRRLAHRGNQINMTLEALLPDKFMQTIVMDLGLGLGNDLILIQTVNGSQAWSEVVSPGGPMAVIAGGKKKGGADGLQKMANNMTALAARMATELSGMPDNFGKNDGGPGARPADQPLIIQASVTPLLLVLLLTSPPLLPIEFTYAGRAKTQDGHTADVLDLAGPNSFSARLLINQQTRQVMTLIYKTRMPGRRADSQTDPLVQTEPEETEVEARWIASDYRKINGLTLPHRIARYTGGQLAEEIEIHKIKVNPALNPDKFVKKERKK